MPYRRLAACIAVAALAACANDAVSYGPGVGSDAGVDRDFFIGSVAASGPDCPAMDFNLRRTASGQLGGAMVDPQNPTGRIGALAGTIAPNGDVNIQITPLGRDVPVGTLVGRMQNGAIVVIRLGPGCPMNNVRLAPAAAPR